MRIRCECGWEKDVDDELSGKKAQCPKCKSKMVLTPYVPPAPIRRVPPPLPEPDDEEFDELPPVPARRAELIDARSVAVTPVKMHVAVTTPSPVAHSLGIASVILGILGLLVCWVPLVGLLGSPLSALGLVLGLVGLIIAAVRRGAGIGFPIAGSAISTLALVICFALNYVIFSPAIADANRAVQRVKERNAAAPVVPAAQGVAPAVGEPQAAPPVERIPTPKEAATTFFEDDQVRVELGQVTIGKVPLKGIQGEGQSEDVLLQIAVRIINKSDAKKLAYRSWSDGQFNRNAASLEDDIGNTYKRITFGFSTTPIGQSGSESIYPGKDIGDLLVFEVPVEKAAHLILELPKAAYGGSGDGFLKVDLSTVPR